MKRMPVMRSWLKKARKYFYLLKYAKYATQTKIIYAITPHATLKNIGDHAQVVAIKKWLSTKYRGWPILEFSKDFVYGYIDVIQRVAGPNDIIFLHSGGNLGDRGLWSENARRMMITGFPNHRIISLPQTIFFSNTEKGKRELNKTVEIYNHHQDLTVMARDPVSFDLAKRYFQSCAVKMAPDFVLYLEETPGNPLDQDCILLCLRRDSESIMNREQVDTITSVLKSKNYKYSLFDTTLDKKIPPQKRESILAAILNIFRQHRLVITDRFHGAIFSVLTGTPCLLLPTVDHKLTSSSVWFEHCPHITYMERLEDFGKDLAALLTVRSVPKTDWKKRYFDPLMTEIYEEGRVERV